MQAAFLLARGRADGLGLLTTKPDAAADAPMALAARSFWALLVAVPGFVALHVMDWAVSGQTAHLAREFVQDLMGFVISWLAFAVMSHRLAVVTGRSALWPRYIAAWNWCNVLQYLMLVVAGLPALLGVPDWVVETAWIVATGWALWLEYFTTKLALAVSGRQAVAMVVLDFALGLATAYVIAGFN